VVVVCAGAKSILDLPATIERLETLGVTVLGYGTSELPGFFTATTGIPVPDRVESPGEVADVFRAQRALGRSAAVLVVQPPPREVALSQQLVDGAVHSALDRAASAGVRGGAVTPYLLAEVERQTAGRSLTVNLALLEANAKLAAEIAVEVSGTRG
jgi:pseudouridine-5'-phosphate glycosidase